jgi:hypothetical protein
MPTAALPKAPLSMGTDEGAQSEYFDALNEAVEALKVRQGANMWNVAGALLDPGRTGSFGEALGRVGQVMGKEQEQRQAMQLPIAQLRAQIAGQKYELANQAEGMKMLGQLLGTSPQQTAEGVQSGRFPGGITRRITPEIYSAFAAKYPKLGEVLKNAASMENDAIKNFIELAKSGVSLAEMEAKFGSDFLELIPKEYINLLRPGQAQPPQQPSTPLTVEGAAAAPAPISQPPTTEQMRQPGVDKSIPLAVRAKGIEERQKIGDEEWKEQRVVFNSWTPDRVNNNIRDLKELHDLADKYPQIWALMQKQGFFAGLQAAAEKGVNTPWGAFSVPVQEFLTKVKLPPDEQKVLARASTIIARQFFENARVNKAVLGPQISNADVTLLQAPMVSTKDAADAIKYYAKESILGMKMRQDYFGALRNWDKETGMKVPFGDFFGSNTFNDIAQRYQNLYDQLYNQHYPYKR